MGAMSYEPVKYFPEDGIVIFSYSVSYSPFFHFFCCCLFLIFNYFLGVIYYARHRG